MSIVPFIQGQRFVLSFFPDCVLVADKKNFGSVLEIPISKSERKTIVSFWGIRQ